MINLNIRFLPITLLSLTTILLLTACPDNTPLNCGDHQIEVNGACECEVGYHWNEDQTCCLMDTTSHNFVWEIDTLGDYGSYLNDVAIVDENNIWAVGYITTDTATYNAAHWNGSEWELILISPAGLLNPISCIFAFNENDIWFGKAGLPVHWDGDNYIKYTPANSTHPGQPTINTIWGSSPDDIYFVGNHGSIVHYDGGSAGGGQGFRKMESGTEVDLRDIDGTPDGEQVFAVGYNDSGALSGQSVALELKDGVWERLFSGVGYGGDPASGNYGLFQTVMVIGDTAYFTTGGTWLVKYNFVEKTTTFDWKYKFFRDGYRLISASGPAPNDVLLTSGWGNIFHYNGKTWKRYTEAYDYFGPNLFYPRSGLLKGDAAVIVGWLGTWAYAPVVRGYRMP